MERVVRYSFKINIVVMKIVGLYPPVNHKRWYKVYAVTLYILGIIPTTIFGALHFAFVENLEINYTDFIIVGIIFHSFKLFALVKNGDKIKHCILYFDDPYYYVRKRHEEIFRECISACRRDTKIFFGGCLSGLMGFYGQIFLRGDIHQLPLNVWIPKNVRENPTLYYSIYVLLAFAVAYVVLACGTVDPLIAGLAHHATTQIKALKENLQNLDKYASEDVLDFRNGLRISKSRKIYLEIKKCLKKYQGILNFVKEYEDCFSPVVFSQFMGSGVEIALCCFQISKMVDFDMNFLIMINYLGTLLFQIFFYCYYGTMLIEESKTLSTAVYMSQWYKYDIRSKKALLILMERSKKPMIVTAGKIWDLSLDTFTMILRKAYSLLAVLSNY